MANILAIHSVGASLVTYLRNSYPDALRTAHPCEFRLLSSGELTTQDDFGTTLSLFLYRVTMNEYLRNTGKVVDRFSRGAPLSIDLHYLMSVWATSALAEQTILAWAMRQFHLHPMLDRSSLSPEAEWETGDVIHVIPAELSNEDIMRIWDALEPSYRLSVSYVARVVRIDGEQAGGILPVVAIRESWTEQRDVG